MPNISRCRRPPAMRSSAARAAGGRVIAVGTTVVRSLETAARAAARCCAPYRGATRIFIKPGYRFRVVDAMVTNFHLPESTLLMLCAAFVGTRRAARGLRARGQGAVPVLQLRRCDVPDARSRGGGARVKPPAACVSSCCGGTARRGAAASTSRAARSRRRRSCRWAPTARSRR